jgi:hypothetical protein
MSKIDLNVDNYTISELLTILGLANPDVKEIKKSSDKLIHRFQSENNPEMINFFQDIEKRLTDYTISLENPDLHEFEPERKQTDNWFKNQYLKQSNKVQDDKITERKGKIDIYNNEHVPMKREQLGVNNTYSVEVAQDVLNPNLKNVTTRIINLDSQYRQSNSINNLSTDYTLDLSESILNVISLRLYSYQIPYSWYAFDLYYSNTCFWITFIDDNGFPIETLATAKTTQVGIPISIYPGNYTMANASVLGSLPNAISEALTDAGFSGFTNENPAASINPSTGKLTLFLFGLTYTNPIDESQYVVSGTTIITFFDPTAQLVCTNVCGQPLAINQTLGWAMGFRVPAENVNATGNTGIAIIDVYGPKYLILVIDDYNQNHINNGLIGITEYSNVLKLPSYYSPDLPYTCIPASPLKTNLTANTSILENDENAGTLLMDKYNATYENIPQVLPSAPRTLTQTQIYTINEILKNNGKTSNNKLSSPTTPDTFAIIPIKHNGLRLGEPIVEFGGTLQDNKRVYFGPVNLERLHIKLLDDKGNVLNLNGSDWSVTLISENLYQY